MRQVSPSGVVTDTNAPSNGAAESVLGSTFSITGTSGTYQDTGLSVTLPSAGTYLIEADVKGVLNTSVAGTFLLAKLYNSTDAADVANSEAMIIYLELTGVAVAVTAHITKVVTVAASKTIKLYVSRSGSGFTATSINSDANGRTRMSYLKVSN